MGNSHLKKKKSLYSSAKRPTFYSKAFWRKIFQPFLNVFETAFYLVLDIYFMTVNNVILKSNFILL